MTKIGLAVQGSFGHMFYALGVLEAIREHNASPNSHKKHFTCASGCVEMLLPLLMFTKDQNSPKSFRSEVHKPNLPIPPLLPAQLDMGSWAKWAETLTQSVLAPGKLFESFFGPPGNLIFNPAFEQEMAPKLSELMIATEVPVFTNATNATDFSEIYLYASKEPLAPSHLEALIGEEDKKPKRQVLLMTPELYFASGARPPFLAPIGVAIDGKRQYWMEGAMRCNPPLNPLIKTGADRILLLRFFTKNRTNMNQNYWAAENEAALLERYLEAIFTIPLEKEIEQIGLLGGQTVKTKHYKHVDIHVIDPLSDEKSRSFISFRHLHKPICSADDVREGNRTWKK